jgi:hypothetical protein
MKRLPFFSNMHCWSRKLVLLLIALPWSLFLMAQEQITINNHFDVIQQLSTVKSKSRQIVLNGKKTLADSKQDSLALLYMNLKATGDGVIGKYKSMIDNPKLANKAGESIEGDMNLLLREMNELTEYYVRSPRKGSGMGYAPVPGLGLVVGVVSLGKELYSEIKNMKAEKRNATKAEVDQYVLPDYDALK